MFALKKTVVVGMSGGVDSSVAALLLKEAGYRVIALFMKNWEEESTDCSSVHDYEDALLVSQQLDIPLYTVNFSKQYWDEVFSHCLKEYAAGYTPNPDILCNREIKFKVFLNKALEVGGDYLATGHYCQKLKRAGEWLLARGRDSEKDQSYFLYTLKSSILDKVLFPLGNLTKKEVRSRAEGRGLVTAKKKDSTGICFIGKRNFKQFISSYLPKTPGNFETAGGRVVGRHEGIAFYTIGQRRGLGIGGAGEPWYVVGKDIQRNVIMVEQGEHHSALFRKELIAKEVSWVHKPPSFPLRCTAKIRYRSPDVRCILTGKKEGVLEVTFEEPQKAVTCRQAVVFYQGDICLGGGLIEE